MDLHLPQDAYLRARRMYGVVIALLFVWVVIGIKVEEVELTGVVLHIYRPHWIPWVFVAMVLYCAYRYNHERTIYANNMRDELTQSDKEDRDKEAIQHTLLLYKIEFCVLNILASMAIMLQIYNAVNYIGN